MPRWNKKSSRSGFALIEVLIAVTILSIILLSIYSGISTSINVMSGAKNYTRAMIIAKSKMNEFIDSKMRGTDLNHEPVEEYENFFINRVTQRFEHPLLGPLPAKETEITVTWRENDREKEYSISYIYPTN
ncbi:MAG: hypothetical protein CVV44_04505 [Spirochaetae bacterium HGW-Spirochaetae-1]|jgi:prepilin-type N-terminal cleavage/methylation domain-containing protein|nr:MAG: hypothetical protein CVV44_04505 [Spirochaetae bacterium HGW-Spirochaetae-1]